jgi:hypothetical protein
VIQEPVQPTANQSPSSRRPGRRPSNGLIGLIIVLGIALAVPVIGVIAAAAPSAPTSAVGASAAPGGSAQPAAGKDKGAKGNNGNGKSNANGNKGLKLKGGQGKGPISITAINGSNVSLKTEDGWTRTITVTSTTVITKGGQTIGVGALNVGDAIRFHQVRNADGTYTVDAINVPTPKAGGEVTAVDANSITVKHGGTTRVITVTGSTVYKVGEAAGTKADVKVGSEIEAQGTVSGDTFTATAIHVELPHIGGQVTAKTATTITVKKGDGTTATIHVSGTTKYKIKGKDPAALTDVAVGDRVSAQGTLRADGSLDAVSVQGKGAKAAKGAGDDDGDDDGPAPSPAAS